MEEGLKAGIKQFFASGKLCEQHKIFIPAADNYFKAFIHIIDLYIYRKIGKMPDSHTERFRFLERDNSALYSLTDSLFPLYVKSYRQHITAEELRMIKDGCRKAFELTGLGKELGELI